MDFDPKAPLRMVKSQKWFGSMLTDDNDTPQEHYLSLPRIKIYREQYHLRLTRVLEESFPFLLRLFGYKAFAKEIAEPFLKANTPDHFLLYKVGDKLLKWLQNYSREDKDLVLAAAEIDWCCNLSFRADHFPLKSMPQADETLFLQPHVYLLEYPADLFSFREKLLEHDVEHWNTNPFPALKKGAHRFIIYRSLEHGVSWKELSEEEFYLLAKFEKGSTIEEALENYPFSEEYISIWFYEWLKVLKC